MKQGCQPDISAPATPKKCPECKGRGWHVGDCHPRETCGVCDGSGVLPVGATLPCVQGGGDGVR